MRKIKYVGPFPDGVAIQVSAEETIVAEHGQAVAVRDELAKSLVEQADIWRPVGWKPDREQDEAPSEPESAPEEPHGRVEKDEVSDA
jgi:hypothetical protein